MKNIRWYDASGLPETGEMEMLERMGGDGRPAEHSPEAETSGKSWM